MSKTKKEPVAQQVEEFKDIKKNYGNVLKGLDFVFEKPQRVISLGPALDWGCGGIEVGTWGIFAGQPKSGKTTTAMQAAKNAQKQFGMHVFYCNVEARFKKQNTEGMDFDPNLFTLITSDEDKILAAEDYLNIIDNILKSRKNSFIIIDSISSLCSESEMQDDVRGNTRLVNPRIIASFCRKVGQTVPIRESSVIGINHIISNTAGMGGKTKMVDGGVKIQFQADTILHVKYFQDWVEGEEVVGQKVHWDVVHTGLAKRGKDVTSYIRYGSGIDRVMEIFQLGTEFAAIEQAGAWYTISALLVSEHPEVKKYIKDSGASSEDDIKRLFKFQGAEKCCAFLTEHPEFIEIVYNYIKDMT